ncbi:single-stranded DNA-binding protein [Cyanobium gracile UHCC 0139]|uniref:Single-stranded DNA-binding protein n=1 Tax=Cyanobium gracile UHCC 0139 TaxID=3110308 RepID=A0ABU5RWG1_9CYAN|nr:single-stranded DNA-binding protein [Cyanobium gracile]MEA5392053.1 single-stranded DNA-binding protein [Cyanobium gracile UHCC 0139]
MNHCLLEVEVLEAPQVRYTQDNQTPVAEMAVQIEGLRPDDPPGQLKVVGWGNLAQDLQNRVQVGQRCVLEGRLRMNTVTRQDGVKEKRAEFTLARLHPLSPGTGGATVPAPAPARGVAPLPTPRPAGAGGAATPAPRRAPAPAPSRSAAAAPAEPAAPVWDTSPLVPLGDDDEIPF